MSFACADFGKEGANFGAGGPRVSGEPFGPLRFPTGPTTPRSTAVGSESAGLHVAPAPVPGAVDPRHLDPGEERVRVFVVGGGAEGRLAEELDAERLQLRLVGEAAAAEQSR